MTVLVVDDSILNLEIAKAKLTNISLVSKILLCSKPEEVEGIIKNDNIDILILDLVMPKITGFDILKMIRSDSQYDNMPIIVATTLDDVESFKKCFKLGATDYINKPIREYEFYARLDAAIRMRNNSKKIKELLDFATKQNKQLINVNSKLKETQFHLVQSEKMAAIGVLSAGIAHEINNPMGFINSNYEVVKKYFYKLSNYINELNSICNNTNNLDEIKSKIKNSFQKYKIDYILSDVNDIFKDAKNGIDRIIEIVKSMSTFTSNTNDEKSIYKLTDIVNEVILICKNDLEHVSQIELNIPDNIELLCNKVLIGQVFINIIMNAVQAIKSQKKIEKGKIKISATKTDDFVNIFISDNGPGIPQENLSRIFEPFFTTKDVGQGMGFGLSISYDIIVLKHNGKIEVVSDPNLETVFTIKLPVSNL